MKWKLQAQTGRVVLVAGPNEAGQYLNMAFTVAEAAELAKAIPPACAEAAKQVEDVHRAKIAQSEKEIADAKAAIAAP